MKIKTLSGEKQIDILRTSGAFNMEVWVKWSDIKPILDEYQAAIENEQQGIGDSSPMTGD